MRNYYKQTEDEYTFKQGVIIGCLGGLFSGMLIGGWFVNIVSTPTVKELERARVTIPEQVEVREQIQPVRVQYTPTEIVENVEEKEPVKEVQEIKETVKETPIIYVNDIKLRDKVAIDVPTVEEIEQEIEND